MLESLDWHGSGAAGQRGGLGGIFGGAGGRGGERCFGTVPAGPPNQGGDGQDANVLAGRAYASTRVGTGGRGSVVFPTSGLNSALVFGTTLPPSCGLAITPMAS